MWNGLTSLQVVVLIQLFIKLISVLSCCQLKSCWTRSSNLEYSQSNGILLLFSRMWPSDIIQGFSTSSKIQSQQQLQSSERDSSAMLFLITIIKLKINLSAKISTKYKKVLDSSGTSLYGMDKMLTAKINRWNLKLLLKWKNLNLLKDKKQNLNPLKKKKDRPRKKR